MTSDRTFDGILLFFTTDDEDERARITETPGEKYVIQTLVNDELAKNNITACGLTIDDAAPYCDGWRISSGSLTARGGERDCSHYNVDKTVKTAVRRALAKRRLKHAKILFPKLSVFKTVEL